MPRYRVREWLAHVLGGTPGDIDLVGRPRATSRGHEARYIFLGDTAFVVVGWTLATDIGTGRRTVVATWRDERADDLIDASDRIEW